MKDETDGWHKDGSTLAPRVPCQIMSPRDTTTSSGAIPSECKIPSGEMLTCSRGRVGYVNYQNIKFNKFKSKFKFEFEFEFGSDGIREFWVEFSDCQVFQKHRVRYPCMQ